MTDVREWARQQGIDVHDRGNISREVISRYDAAHPAPAAAGPDEDDYDQGVTEADFPPDDDPAPGAPPGTAEKAPRITPRGGRARLGRLFERPAKPKKAGGRKARVKLDGFAENLWTDLAAAAPWPPLQKMLTMQAAYAATTLDGVVAGTFVDPALQVAARADATLRAVDGLLGPPILVAAICATGRVETGPDGKTPITDPVTGQPVYDGRTRMMFGLLKYSLMQMGKISAGRMEELEERAEEMAGRAASADAMIAFLFSQPVPPSDEVVKEEARAEAAGRPVPGFTYPPPSGMDGTGADPGRT